MPRPGRIGSAAAPVQTLVVEVHPVDPFGVELRHRLGQGGCRMPQAGTHVGGARAEVLKDDRHHDLRSVRVSRIEQTGQLARIPDRCTGVVGERAVVVDV